MEQFVDIGLYVAYVLVIVAVIAAIVLPIINSIGHPKTLILPILSIVGLVVLFFIGYAIANDDLTGKAIADGVTPGISKMVGGALITMYVLFAAALIGIVFTEFNKAIK